MSRPCPGGSHKPATRFAATSHRKPKDGNASQGTPGCHPGGDWEASASPGLGPGRRITVTESWPHDDWHGPCSKNSPSEADMPLFRLRLRLTGVQPISTRRVIADTLSSFSEVSRTRVACPMRQAGTRTIHHLVTRVFPPTFIMIRCASLSFLLNRCVAVD